MQDRAISEEPDMQIERLVQEYRVFLGRKQLNRMPRILKKFIEYVRVIERQIDRFTFRDMENFIIFLMGAKMTRQQIAQEFSILRKFYDYLCATNVLPANLARDVFARAGKKELRVYSDGELIGVFRTHHPRA